jgi:crotonobetainyl-CoA:carnitine CoA-transferase CaiB-like acyl-CoA transferase
VAGPLAGVRVVEVGTHVFVPMAGTVLTEWGAEVVKVEEPRSGDPYRHLATAGLHTTFEGHDTFFQSANRGKRSVCLDLTRREGRALLGRLLGQADVFTTSLRSGALDRLGLDVDSVRRDNPSVLYVRATAFGPRGPDAALGGYDTTAFWARSGMQHLLSPIGSPYPPAPRAAFGDVVGALAVAGAVSAALYRRDRTGEPTVVDASLLGTGLWQVQTDLVDAAIAEERRERPPRAEAANPLTLPYRTADGRFVQLTMLAPELRFDRLRQAVGRPDLALSVDALDELFAERTLAEWRQVLAGFEGEWAPVQTPEEVLADPQVRANAMVTAADLGDGVALPLVTTPVQFDEEPGTARRAPEHGEHTEEVLLELGLTWDEVVALKEQEVIP